MAGLALAKVTWENNFCIVTWALPSSNLWEFSMHIFHVQWYLSFAWHVSGYENTTPPPSKNITGSFVCGINFVGIIGQIGNVAPGIISEDLIFMGLPESLARSQHSVRLCELGTNKDYRKYR